MTMRLSCVKSNRIFQLSLVTKVLSYAFSISGFGCIAIFILYAYVYLNRLHTFICSIIYIYLLYIIIIDM